MFILHICDYQSFKDLYRLLKICVIAIKIAVPILLIVFAMIRLASCIRTGDEDALKQAQKSLVNNCIAAVVIFLIPTIVNLIVKMTTGDETYKRCFETSYIEYRINAEKDVEIVNS